jgi:hypothetical protein
MDSEVTNLAQVKAFDSSDYATAAQGTNADTAHGWGDHGAAGYLTSHQSLSAYAPLASPTFTGNLLVGLTSTSGIATGSTADNGVYVDGSVGAVVAQSSANKNLYLSKASGYSDPDFISFQVNGSSVGSIGTRASQLSIGSADTGLEFNNANDNVLPHNTSTNSGRDAAIDLGASGTRFKDLHLSGRITSNQPSTAFTCTNQITLTNDSTWRKIALNKVIHQTGGSHFSTSNNRFTAPVAGRYLFGMDIQLESVSGSIVWMYIVPFVNGSFNGNSGAATADFTPPNATYSRRTGTFLINLSANDYVDLYHIGAGNGTVVLKQNTESAFFLTLL